MDLVGKARRVRIYVNEEDRVGRSWAAQAIVKFLREEDAQGATVFRGVEGFGATGEIHVSHLAEAARRLPIVIEWVDSPERVDRLLPRIKQLVPRGFITVDDTEIVLYEPHAVRELSKALTAADVMTRKVTSARRDTPIREVVEMMLGKTYRTVPVLDGRMPVGIVSSGDLVQRGGLGVRLELLARLDGANLHAVLDQLSERGGIAEDVMTPGPVTVPESMPLPAVADVMARGRLKRLPVVAADGSIAGMVSRVDLLRTAAHGFEGGEERQWEPGFAADTPLSRVMRRDIPTVFPETPLAEVFQAIIATRLHRALVIDADRHVLGLVTDAELLDRVAPSLRPTALRSLMLRLPFIHASAEERTKEHHAHARHAAELMRTGVPTAREDTMLGPAIAAMLKGNDKVLGVVDSADRLVGVVDRADLLHGLVREGDAT